VTTIIPNDVNERLAEQKRKAHADYMREYNKRPDQKEKVSLRNKRYYEENKKEINAKRAEQWKNRTPEQIIKEKNRVSKRYQNNKEEYHAASAKWAKENPERAKEIHRMSVRKNYDKDKNREIVYRWKKNNPEAYEMCRRNQHYKRYGITVSDYEQILESQGGVCKICGMSDPGKRIHHFHVDHDPTKPKGLGCVRGLLCHGCNTSIGHFQHKTVLLRRAADYLDEFASR
jgi:hypothetical protein